jgi:outer membrane lipoprotein carrier protein
MRLIKLMGGFFLTGLLSLSAQQNIVQNVQRTYQGIDNAVITYEQVIEFPLTRAQQTFQGIVYMKRPGYYRIESEQQTVVTDGSTIWSYNPFTDQVIIDLYKEDEQIFTPDRFLLNIPDDFYVTVGERETVAGTPLILLRLVPKDDHQYVRSMRLWVDDTKWIVRVAEIIDLNDNKTTYHVRDIQMNTGLDMSLFTYQPPENIEIIDLR